MNFKIKHLIQHPLVKDITEEQKRILKIITRDNEYRYDMWMHSSKEKIEKLIQSYYEAKYYVDELNKSNIPINILKDLEYPEYHQYFARSLPIFNNWLQDNNTPRNVKSNIIYIVLNTSTNYKDLRKDAKDLLFDTMLELYKASEKSYWDDIKDEPKNIELMQFNNNLENAIWRWADDKHANEIFLLLNDADVRKSDLILDGMTRFKESSNKKKAIEILVNEMQIPEQKKTHLIRVIKALRKLDARDAKAVIEQFLEFPKNYKKRKPTYFSIGGREKDSSDAEVRSEARKTIEKFNK